MNKLAIFMYRNVRSKQVLVSKAYDIMGDLSLLKQIPNNAILPKLTRPDMWMPMVVAHGFKSANLHLDMYSMLTHHLPSPETIVETTKVMTMEEYKQLPLKKKREFESDMINGKVDQLCRVLLYLNNKDKKADYNLKLFWENPTLAQTGLEGSGLEWPSNVEHSKLELVRGNMIMNREIRNLCKLQK